MKRIISVSLSFFILISVLYVSAETSTSHAIYETYQRFLDSIEFYHEYGIYDSVRGIDILDLDSDSNTPANLVIAEERGYPEPSIYYSIYTIKNADAKRVFYAEEYIPGYESIVIGPDGKYFYMQTTLSMVFCWTQEFFLFDGSGNISDSLYQVTYYDYEDSYDDIKNQPGHFKNNSDDGYFCVQKHGCIVEDENEAYRLLEYCNNSKYIELPSWNGGDISFLLNKKDLSSISVILDGRKIVFDQQPIIIDGRTLVPLRAIFEELGATVNWDGDTQTVTSTKGNTTISMSIGKAEMYRNGKLITLDVVPQLIGDRTLVPVRAVAEGFDCKVDWDGDNKTVIIKTIDTEKVINTAKNLYQANEDMGGVTNLATYAEVDTLLYNSLNEIDKTLAVNEFTLDMVSAGTTATIAAAKVSTGNYSSIDNIGDGLSKLLSSKEIADAADGVLKDAIKQRVFNEISSSVPDANAFILNLGRSAYDRNSKMIQEFIVLHSKFKSENYTYDDAVAYIVMHDTLVMNRKTMSMAVEVLSDELPQNFLESLLMSAEASAKAVLGGLFGDAFGGREIAIPAELFTDIITAYTDYVCGQSADLFKYMKQMNHPVITEWANEFEVYENNLSQKLGVK